MVALFSPALTRLALLSGGIWVTALTGQLAAQGGAMVAPLEPAPLSLPLQSLSPQQQAFRQAVIEAAGDQTAIVDFFAARAHAPFFTAEGPEASLRREALFSAFAAVSAHALPESRYPAVQLRQGFQSLRSEGDRGRLEVRMVQALLSYARDLHSGILDPKRIDPMIVRDLPRPDPVAVLAGYEADPIGYLRKLPPQNPEYARLARARLHMMDQIARGGWGPQVRAESLKVGVSGPQVVVLRDRLQAMGFMGRSASQSYDEALRAAVRRFQAAHGLNEDGAAGPATLRAVNVSAEERLGAITVAMERERWANIPRGDRHIWVNLADFNVQIIDDGKVSFETRAVIGSTNDEKRTPEFSHRMTYMEVNPDWTVPPGIVRRDYLPRLQANPNALSYLNVVDSRGRVIPRDQINFASYTARNFPFMLRQPPGPRNSLGQVKFMFPNPWSIYLHDTPDKHLFQRDARAFSAGCVRLNDPKDFAYALLAVQDDNPQRTFQRALDSGKQTRISLKDPVPIHLDYRTAFTDQRGVLHYRGDIYGRDAMILAALRKAGVDG